MCDLLLLAVGRAHSALAIVFARLCDYSYTPRRTLLENCSVNEGQTLLACLDVSLRLEKTIA